TTNANTTAASPDNTLTSPHTEEKERERETHRCRAVHVKAILRGQPRFRLLVPLFLHTGTLQKEYQDNMSSLIIGSLGIREQDPPQPSGPASTRPTTTPAVSASTN
ncbi:uncharacterized protein GLRG_00544, partial [Colletotrichum graminicola M1.001]